LQYPDFVLNEKIVIDSEEERSESYRYSLHIPLKREGQKRYAVIMMNPSTADSSHSDPTIDRVIRFIGFNDAEATEISIVNLYAERETYSEYLELKKHKHCKNIKTIREIFKTSDIVILGWGKPTKGSQERLHEIRYHHIALEVLEVCLDLKITPTIIESLREDLYPRHLGRISYADNLVNHDLQRHIEALKNRIQKNTSKFQSAPNAALQRTSR
jgi:hypothetical protein